MILADFLTTIRLDPGINAPLFRQLYEAIKQAILDGTIAPGIQLPPTRSLAVQIGVSRQTVLNTYSQLMAEGYLSGTVGKGTFISEQLPISANAKRPVAPESTGLLRPLSARGERFVGPRTYLNIHEGMPKAFRIGMPGVDVFPFDIWARLEARRWRRPSHDLGYGDPAGFAPLRAALATYLRASRGVHCQPEQIIVTSGSQQALYLIATMLLSPGDAAWVEEPGYRGINASLHAAEAHVCAVPVDGEGLQVSHGARHHPDAKLVYVTPSHQLPLGVTMSLQRRLELLAWAAEKKMWVVEDDYDSEYRYTGPPLASLQSLNKTGCVIYVGTLSKLLFPGLRLGYMVVPPSLADAFAQGRAIMDRHAATMPQIVLTDFITEGHFSRHIKRSREIYGERREALLKAIDTHLIDEFELGPADGGLHLSVHFRKERDDYAASLAALRHGLEVRALSRFYNEDATADMKQARASGLLLGFAAVSVKDLNRGAAVLQLALQE